MNKNIICCNCGRKGHIYRYCQYPKTSLGIISYTKLDNKMKYLMICRKQTHGFVEFFRGKYKLSQIDLLKRIIDEMTNEEKTSLLNDSFGILWSKIWYNPDLTTYNDKQLMEYSLMKKKLFKMKKGWWIKDKIFKLKDLICESKTSWIEPEWGFPKGKRKINETEFQCAKREFCEETGLSLNQCIIQENILPFSEEFIGSNNVRYKSIYYIGKLNISNDYKFEINKMNKEQYYEVSKIGLFSYEECLNLIRSYNTEKKQVLSLINNLSKHF